MSFRCQADDKRAPAGANTVALVGDHGDARHTLAALGAGWRLTRYGTGSAALREIPPAPPKAALIEVKLPDGSGIECTRKLRELTPALRVIMFTASAKGSDIFESLAAGATGYVIKPVSAQELARAIGQAGNGGTFLCPRSMAVFITNQLSLASGTRWPETLTPREKEIAAWLMEGARYKDIAGHLGLATDTAHAHVRNIYRKLQVHHRAELTRKLRPAA